MGDYEFLRLALDDQEWVSENHLYLYRSANYDEYDRALPRPKLKEPMRLEQRIILSTRPKDVADYIAKKLADRSYKYPNIFLENLAATTKNIYSLEHKVSADIPLVRSSAVKALYIRSQIWLRPVSLKTIALSSWLPSKNKVSINRVSIIPIRIEEGVTPIDIMPIRIEVEPNGIVRVFYNNLEHPELTALYQKPLDRFKEELEGSIHEELKKTKDAICAFLSFNYYNSTKASMHLMSHSATSATAIQRYQQMVKRRLYNAIKRALAGKAPLKKIKNGVRISSTSVYSLF